MSASCHSASSSLTKLRRSVTIFVIPPEGSHVEIGYVIDHEAGDDDDSGDGMDMILVLAAGGFGLMVVLIAIMVKLTTNH